MPRTPDANVNNTEDAVDPTVNDDDTQGYDVGSRWINTVSGAVFFAVDVTSGAAVWTDVSGVASTPPKVVGLGMALGGHLDVPALPLSDVGSEIVVDASTLVLFGARRGVPGTSGTTTIQLEVNGALVGGATLSWTPSDGAFAAKTTVIGQSVVANDRVSFRLTSAEAGAQDIFAVVR